MKEIDNFPTLVCSNLAHSTLRKTCEMEKCKATGRQIIENINKWKVS